MKVHYRVDQKAAVLAGSNFFGDVVTEIDPATLTQAQREELALCPCGNEKGQDTSPYDVFLLMRGCDGLPVFGVADDVNVVTLLNERIRIRAEKKAKAESEREKHVQDLLAKTDEECISEQWNRIEICGFYHAPSDDPRVKEKYTRVQDLLEQKKAEKAERDRQREQEKEAREKAEAAAAAEAEAVRKAQLDAWIVEHGTDNQKKRHDLGLLPEKEILDAIREEAFSPLGSFPRYDKLTKQDVPCDCEGYQEPEYKFRAHDATSATAEEFETMDKIATAIRSVHPEANVCLREHIGWCETCHGEDKDEVCAERKSVLVSIKVGVLDFSREYQIP